jgi:hypothetical protein
MQLSIIGKIKHYIWNLLIAIDQLINTIFGGDPDETISSRLGKNRNRNSFTRFISDFLDLFEWKHVEKSVEEDEGDDNSL